MDHVTAVAVTTVFIEVAVTMKFIVGMLTAMCTYTYQKLQKETWKNLYCDNWLLR